MSETALLLLAALITFFAIVPYSVQRIMTLRQNQKKPEVTPEVHEAIMLGIRTMIQKGKLQDAIRVYQEYQDVDVLTAKQAVVDMQRTLRDESESSITRNAAGHIIRLVRQGKVDDAIETYRKSTGSDLSTAKRAIAQIQQAEANLL
jgi:hypothetical protein